MKTFDLKNAFSGFSVDKIDEAKKFYSETLGFDVEETEQGLQINRAGSQIFVYRKADHEAATYTMLNIPVDDIDEAVDELTARGVVFEFYEGLTDEKGIARGKAAGYGPDIAWFRDPAGNILSILN